MAVKCLGAYAGRVGVILLVSVGSYLHKGYQYLPAVGYLGKYTIDSKI